MGRKGCWYDTIVARQESIRRNDITCADEISSSCSCRSWPRYLFSPCLVHCSLIQMSICFISFRKCYFIVKLFMSNFIRVRFRLEQAMKSLGDDTNNINNNENSWGDAEVSHVLKSWIQIQYNHHAYQVSIKCLLKLCFCDQYL